MKKLKYILFLFICLLSLNISVKAWDYQGAGGSIAGISGATGGHQVGNYDQWFTNGLGYRISLISYKTGTDIQNANTIKSKTFLSDNYNTMYKHTSSDKNSKIEYLKTHKDVEWINGNPENTGDFADFSKNDGIDWNPKSRFVESDYRPVIDHYFNLVNNAISTSDTSKLEDTLYKIFGLKIDDPEICNTIENYYIVIEPMATLGNGGYFGTMTELYRKGLNLDKQRWSIVRYGIHTPTTNFKLGNKDLSFDIINGTNIANDGNVFDNNGLSMGLLWIGFLKDRCKTCYEPKLKEGSSGKLICGKVDENNSSFYEEEYKEVSCDKLTKEQQKDTKDGKWMGTSNSCSMYCTKTLQASFPGNLSGNVMLGSNVRGGSYFAWPTQFGTGLYDMSITASYKCKAVSDKNGSCSNSDIDNLKKAVKSKIKSEKFNIELTAGNNKKLDHVKLNTKLEKTEDLTNGDSITISEKVSFSIPNNKNRYFNVVTEEVNDSPFGSKVNFDRKIGVVSLDKNTKIKDSSGRIINYPLTLNAKDLGNFNTIGGKSVTDYKDGFLGNYECNYRLTTGPCTCPNDSDKAGESVECEYEYNKNSNANYTCVDAINDYCYLSNSSDNSSYKNVPSCDDGRKKVCYDTDGNTVDITTCIAEKMKNGESEEEADKNCRITLCKSCKNPITGTVIREPFSDCLKEGSSYKSCYAKYCLASNCVGDECFYYCEGNNCKWKDSTNENGTISKLLCEGKVCNFKFYCPGGNTEDMDPTSCVIEKSGYSNLTAAYNQGKITDQQLNQYLAECERVVCPIGNKVIYREIDLNNPFPGKNNEGKLTDFSNNGRGRKPGSNWNSKKVVETKILNARGSKGYSLYNEKPMYVITLTPATIKSIRDYNKTRSYSDFTLKCNDDNHSNCISSFLHTNYYDILSDNGKCKNIKNETDFKECYKNT